MQLRPLRKRVEVEILAFTFFDSQNSGIALGYGIPGVETGSPRVQISTSSDIEILLNTPCPFIGSDSRARSADPVSQAAALDTQLSERTLEGTKGVCLK